MSADPMARGDRPKAQRLARECLESAKRFLGNGWQHVSPEVRRALVMERAFDIVLNQDDSIGTHRVVMLACDLAAECDGLLTGASR